MKKRLWLKVESGDRGNPISHLQNGKIVLFSQKMLPPIGRVVDAIIQREDSNKVIAEWTGAMKPMAH
jgi:hypothetical protein